MDKKNENILCLDGLNGEIKSSEGKKENASFHCCRKTQT
jgi:hypothetical protein